MGLQSLRPRPALHPASGSNFNHSWPSCHLLLRETGPQASRGEKPWQRQASLWAKSPAPSGWQQLPSEMGGQLPGNLVLRSLSPPLLPPNNLPKLTDLWQHIGLDQLFVCTLREKNIFLSLTYCLLINTLHICWYLMTVQIFSVHRKYCCCD